MTLWVWALSEAELVATAIQQRKCGFGWLQLQDIHYELYMGPMVLEVASRRRIGDVIELLAPIDIGKGAIEKA